MSERPDDRGPLDFDLGDETAAPAGGDAGERRADRGARSGDRGPLDFDPADEGLARADRRPADGGGVDGRLPSPPRAARLGGTYLWVVGVAALVLVLVLVVSTVQHGTGRGARGVANGAVVPPFAVPLALSNLDGDANLATKPGEGQAGDRPACEVRGPRVLNGCALRERGPFVLAFFTTGGRCVVELDAMERARRQVPGVQFAAVAIRGDRGDLRALIRAHGWRFPVGYDRDGALANAYHVQVCPQLTFARRGGRVAETTFGDVGTAQLTAKARRLLARW